MEIDLDALRAARREAQKDDAPNHVKFAGKRFGVGEIPWSVCEGIALGDEALIVAGVQELLGNDWAAFKALKPTVEDVISLAAAAATIGGLRTLGESDASGGSSRGTSRRSRRTSNGSTRSTSAKRSGGRTG